MQSHERTPEQNERASAATGSEVATASCACAAIADRPNFGETEAERGKRPAEKDRARRAFRRLSLADTRGSLLQSMCLLVFKGIYDYWTYIYIYTYISRVLKQMEEGNICLGPGFSLQSIGMLRKPRVLMGNKKLWS